MASDIHQAGTRGSPLGYAIVLLGGALFVTSCFLPYQRLMVPGGRTDSLYQVLTIEPIRGGIVGVYLYLFGGVAVVAALAIIALVRGERGTMLPSLLAGAVAAWALTWIGLLLRVGADPLVSVEEGFWLQAVGIGVAVIGTLLVVTRRRGAHERGAAARMAA